MIPSSAVGRYRSELRKIVDTASGSFKAALLEDLPRLSQMDPEELLEELVWILRDYVMVYGDEAATLAADFYSELAEAAGVKVPDPTLYQWGNEEYYGFVQRHMDDLAEGLVDKFVRGMQGVLSNMVKTSANRTMGENAVVTNKVTGQRKPRRKGKPSGVRFARVPTGPTTCAFCIMLASRGFVYASRETAGQFEKYHDNCDCIVIPEFDNEGIEGYDPDVYLKQWYDADGDLKQLRRNLYPEQKDHINEVRRATYARNKALEGGD